MEKSINWQKIRPWVGWGIVAVVFVLITLLFLHSQPGYELFVSDQNHYFVHGLRMAGREFLAYDWYAHTKSYHIAFALLAAGLDQAGHLQGGIDVIMEGVRVVFALGAFLASYGLAGRISEKWGMGLKRVDRAGVALTTLLVVVTSTGPEFPLGRYFEKIGLEGVGAFWEQLGNQLGLAEHPMLGEYLVPASFVVFLLLGFGLLYFERWLLATACFGVAGIFHFNFFLSGGVIVLVLAGYLFRKGEKGKAWGVMGLYAAMNLPGFLYYMLVVWDPMQGREGLEILFVTSGKAAYFGFPELWWQGSDTLHVIVLVLVLGLHWLVGEKAEKWAYLGALTYIFVGIGIVQLTGNLFVVSMMTWRSSSFLYSVAFLGLVTLIVVGIVYVLKRIHPAARYGVYALALVVLFLELGQFGWGARPERLEWERRDRDLYAFYQGITENTNPDDVILFADDEAFRLAVQRAVYVDIATVPIRGDEVIEYWERVQFVRDFYTLDGEGRQAACQEVGAGYYVLEGERVEAGERVVVEEKGMVLVECP